MRNFKFWIIAPVLVFLVACGSAETKKARHLEKGNEYFSQKQYKEAIIEYKNVLQLDANNKVAFKNLAMSYYLSKEVGQAVPYFLKARELNPEDIEVRKKLSQIFLAMQKPSEAKAEAEFILEKSPQDVEALGVLVSAVGKKEEAEGLLERIKGIQPNPAEAQRFNLLLGTLYLKKGDLSNAEDSFLDALKGEANSPEAHLALGDIAVLKRDNSQAEREYQAAVNAAPEQPGARMRLAEFYHFTKRPGEAKKILREVVNKDPDFTPALIRLGRMEFEEKNLDETGRIVESVLDKNRGDPEARILKAQLQLAKNQPGDAAANMEELIKARPDILLAHYLLALAYSGTGDVGKAKAELRETLNRDPNFEQATVLLAELNIRAKTFQNVADDLFRVLDRNPKNFEALLLVAEAAGTPGEAGEALKRFNKVQAEFADQSRYWLALWTINMKLGDLLAAEAALNEAQSKKAGLAEVHSAMGDLALARNDPQGAAKEYRKAVELASGPSPAHMKLAGLLVREKKAGEAKAFLSEAVGKWPKFVSAYVELARLNFEEGKPEECMKSLDHALALNPSDPDALLLRGQVKLAQKNPAEALADFQKISLMRPESAQLNYLMGVAYLQSQDLNSARTRLRQALNSDPNMVDAGVVLAEMDIRSGSFQTAAESLEKLFQKRQKTEPVYLLLGSAYMGMKQPGKASALFRELLETKPGDGRATFLLGTALQAEGKKGEARKLLEEAARLSPDAVDAFVELIGMDVQEKNYNAAIERINERLEKAPSARIYEVLGRVRTYQKEYAAAEAAYLKAVEMDPKSTRPYVALAQVYAMTGAYDQALAKTDEAIRLNSKNIGALMLSGMLCHQKGDIKKAQQAYEQLLAIEPNFIPAVNNLAYLLSESLGDNEKALKLATKARELAPEDPSVGDTLGWILYKKGNPEWALSYIQESAAKLPENAEVQYHLGMVNIKLGNSEAAKESLGKALKLNPNLPASDEIKRVLERL